jgi:hypothetical protein
VALLFATVMMLSIVAASPAVAETNASVSTPAFVDTLPSTNDTGQSTDSTVGATSHDSFAADMLIYDADSSGGMNQVYAGADSEYLYFEIEYEPTIPEGTVAVALDTDQRLATGTNSEGLSNYDIGADNALVTVIDGSESLSQLGEWNDRTAAFEPVASERTSDLVASKTYRRSDSVAIAVARESIANPDAIDLILAQGFQDGGSEQFIPPRDEETITFELDSRSNDSQEPSEFDFGIELQQEATASPGGEATITAYPSNNAETTVSDALLELAVDKNRDGQFTDSDVVTSQRVDFAPTEYRTIDLTYSNIQLDSGEYAYQARISKNGQTTTSFTNGTLTINSTEQNPDENTVIETEEVSVNGSTVSIPTNDKTSIAVTELPSDVSVTPDKNGIYDSSAGEILYGGPTTDLPETVTFTLTPGEQYTPGDTIEFVVDGEPVTLDVTAGPSVPSQLADRGVSAQSYAAVVNDNEQLGAGNLAGAIQSWAGDDGSQQGFVGETNVGAGELSSMINYWASEVAN